MRLFVAIDIDNDDIEKIQNYLCEKLVLTPGMSNQQKKVTCI